MDEGMHVNRKIDRHPGTDKWEEIDVNTKKK